MKILSITPLYYEIVADERDLIEKSLIKMCDEYQCDLVVTTGGTGPALRDITHRSHRKSVPKNASWFWRAYAND
ncbi:hypothetical protein Kyoto28A_12210 [Helicobacter pylori]